LLVIFTGKMGGGTGRPAVGLSRLKQNWTVYTFSLKLMV
jgi:hypothetical protein